MIDSLSMCTDYRHGIRTVDEIIFALGSLSESDKNLHCFFPMASSSIHSVPLPMYTITGGLTLTTIDCVHVDHIRLECFFYCEEYLNVVSF